MPTGLRAAGVEVEHADSWEARALNEAWRTWVSLGRPFVIYKAAMTLDGSLTVPGERWVSGEESRRLVHELRAQVDAVAVGGGTARADRPRLDARDVDTPRGQPTTDRLLAGAAAGRARPRASQRRARRTSCARSPRKASSRCSSKAARRSRRRSSRPTSSTSCSSSSRRRSPAPGRAFIASLPSPRTLSHLSARQIGGDVLLEAYVHQL